MSHGDDKLTPEERSKVRHDLGTVVSVLKTALTMVDRGDEVRSELLMMIETPRDRLDAILKLLKGG